MTTKEWSVDELSTSEDLCFQEIGGITLLVNVGAGIWDYEATSG